MGTEWKNTRGSKEIEGHPGFTRDTHFLGTCGKVASFLDTPSALSAFDKPQIFPADLGHNLSYLLAGEEGRGKAGWLSGNTDLP